MPQLDFFIFVHIIVQSIIIFLSLSIYLINTSITGLFKHLNYLVSIFVIINYYYNYAPIECSGKKEIIISVKKKIPKNIEEQHVQIAKISCPCPSNNTTNTNNTNANNNNNNNNANNNNNTNNNNYCGFNTKNKEKIFDCVKNNPHCHGKVDLMGNFTSIKNAKIFDEKKKFEQAKEQKLEYFKSIYGKYNLKKDLSISQGILIKNKFKQINLSDYIYHKKSNDFLDSNKESLENIEKKRKFRLEQESAPHDDIF